MKPPPPPTEAFAARKAVAYSSMPPPMSMPLRDAETERRVASPSDAAPPFPYPPPANAQPSISRKAWVAMATLVGAVLFFVVGRSISSSSAQDAASAATMPPIDPDPSTAHRLQPEDFRGVVVDPATPSATRGGQQPDPAAEAQKAEARRRKTKKAKASLETTEPESADEAPAAAAETPAPTAPVFEAPQPPAPSTALEFSSEAAQSALEEAAALAATCRQEDTPAGLVRVAVTFAPSGQVTFALVEAGAVRGTPAGSCVASKFRTVRVPPFSGSKVTVHKTITF
jgi:hypothetical protein